jgi:hypothetical protein
MNTDISKMFQDKNKEIFQNSLILEMERNLESLKNTTDNCVSLEINKLTIFFSKYFNESNIEYKKEELLGILFREKTEINKIINAKIEEKKIRIRENFLSKEIKSDIVEKSYLDEYYEFLSEETKLLNEETDLLLKTEICTKFFPNILKKYKLNTKEQEERLNSRINVLFKDTIIRRIKEQSLFRDESLKNMSLESYNKYLELNRRTIE